MNDASRGFWKLMRNKFKSLGMVSVPGDEALYIKKADGKKEAIIVTHVDDFQVASSTRFLEEMIEILTKDRMEISKIEKELFRFTGIDINRNKEKGEITLDMEDYAESIKEIEEIREAKDDKELTLYERKVLKKMTGKLSWLAEGCRPDLSFNVLEMSRKNNKATIKDLKDVNKVLKKVRGRPSKITLKKLMPENKLMIFGETDALYKQGEKSIGGQIVLLGSRKSEKVNMIYWKSKTIDRVCESSKDAEARGLTSIIDTSKLLTSQLEVLLSDNKKIPIKIYTDNVPVLESIASSMQTKNKYLRNSYAVFKQQLEFNDVELYNWMDGERMIADIMTKDKTSTSSQIKKFDDLFTNNIFKEGKEEHNHVIWKKDEIVLLNPRRKGTRKSEEE